MGGILNSLFGSAQAGGTTSISSQYEKLMMRQDYMDELERARLVENAMSNTTTGTGGSLVQSNPNIFSSLPVQAPPVDLNTLPSMQIGLAEVYDLWVVKWGDKWVMANTLRATFLEDNFNWASVAQRLRAVGKMETWGDTNAYRIIPLDLWK